MELKQAIEILKSHNEWRRGAEILMTDPTTLGEAIDTIVDHFRGTTKKVDELRRERDAYYERLQELRVEKAEFIEYLEELESHYRNLEEYDNGKPIRRVLAYIKKKGETDMDKEEESKALLLIEKFKDWLFDNAPHSVWEEFVDTHAFEGISGNEKEKSNLTEYEIQASCRDESLVR